MQKKKQKNKSKNPDFIQKTRVNWQFTNLGPKGHNLTRLYAKVEYSIS